MIHVIWLFVPSTCSTVYRVYRVQCSWAKPHWQMGETLLINVQWWCTLKCYWMLYSWKSNLRQRDGCDMSSDRWRSRALHCVQSDTACRWPGKHMGSYGGLLWAQQSMIEYLSACVGSWYALWMSSFMCVSFCFLWGCVECLIHVIIITDNCLLWSRCIDSVWRRDLTVHVLFVHCKPQFKCMFMNFVYNAQVLQWIPLDLCAWFPS